MEARILIFLLHADILMRRKVNRLGRRIIRILLLDKRNRNDYSQISLMHGKGMREGMRGCYVCAIDPSFRIIGIFKPFLLPSFLAPARTPYGAKPQPY